MSNKQKITTEPGQRYDTDRQTGRSEYQGGSSSTTARAHARESESRLITVEDLAQLRAAYLEAVGQRMQPMVERMVCDVIGRGMELAVVLHAVEITGWAPRPSAHYLRAVLRRYEDCEIQTEGDVERDEWRRSGEREIYAAELRNGT